MFINIEDDNVIQSKEVVGIIDYNVVSSSTINEEMLSELEKGKKVIIPEENPTKSIVITTDKVYYSSLSVLTLRKRASMISTISKLEDYSESNHV